MFWVVKKLFSIIARVIYFFSSFAIVVVLVFFLMIGSHDTKGTSLRQPADIIGEQRETSIISTTAQELASAYDANTVEADMKFKGKSYYVSGVVESINTDFLNQPYLVLDGRVDEFMQPQFIFDNSSGKDRLASLRRGMGVMLICTGAGDVAKTPMSNNCKFAP